MPRVQRSKPLKTTRDDKPPTEGKTVEPCNFADCPHAGTVEVVDEEEGTSEWLCPEHAEEEADPEEDGDELESDAATAPTVPRQDVAASLSAPPPPVPGQPEQKVVRVPVMADAWTPPRDSVFVKVQRHEPTGLMGNCGQMAPSGEVLERFDPKVLSAEGVLRTWGSGTYQFFHFGADGKVCGRKFAVKLDNEAFPPKPLTFKPPPPPPAPPPREPAPPPPPREPGRANASELVGVLQEALKPDANPLATFILLQDYAERRAEGARMRDREEYQMSLDRTRNDYAMQLEGMRARHQMQMQEDDARHRRELEHTTTLTQQLIRNGNAATSVTELKNRIGELETELDEVANAAPEQKPSEWAQLVPVLAPIVGDYLAKRGGGGLPPAGTPPAT